MRVPDLERTTGPMGFKALRTCLRARLASDLGWTALLVFLILAATVLAATAA